jgi:hypothetical protein
VKQEDAKRQELHQVWFAGVHCNVGGGYRDPGLSEIALLWMAEKARASRLAFKPDHLVVKTANFDPARRSIGIEVAPDPCAELRDSRTRYYRLMRTYDRRLAGDKRAKVDGGSLASSAKTRHSEDGSYRPPGVSEWLAAARSITLVPDGRGSSDGSRAG